MFKKVLQRLPSMLNAKCLVSYTMSHLTQFCDLLNYVISSCTTSSYYGGVFRSIDVSYMYIGPITIKL